MKKKRFNIRSYRFSVENLLHIDRNRKDLTKYKQQIDIAEGDESAKASINIDLYFKVENEGAPKEEVAFFNGVIKLYEFAKKNHISKYSIIDSKKNEKVKVYVSKYNTKYQAIALDMTLYVPPLQEYIDKYLLDNKKDDGEDLRREYIERCRYIVNNLIKLL